MCLAIIFSSANAQEVIKRFYGLNGETTDESNSVYYHLVKEKYQDGDTARSYYTKSGSVRSMTIVDEHGIGNGPSVHYYENGVIKAKGFYEKGQSSGEAQTWYADGRPQSIEFYVPSKEGESGSFGLSDYWDTQGNHIVVKGKGFCECILGVFQEPNSKILAKGKIVDAERDSVWVGYCDDGTKYYEEIYERGKLQSGVSFDNAGIRYTYTTEMEMATFQGGFPGLADHLRRTVRYPKVARKRGVEGKVFVEFIVAENGQIQNAKVLKGIGYECDEEAVNAVTSCPRWNPGKKRGQPVKVRMVLPVSFKLQ